MTDRQPVRARKAANDAEAAAGGNAIVAATGGGRRKKSAKDDRGVPLPDGVMPEAPHEEKGRAASQKGLKPAYFMLRWMAMSKAFRERLSWDRHSYGQR